MSSSSLFRVIPSLSTRLSSNVTRSLYRCSTPFISRQFSTTYPDDRKYTESHEWVKIDEGVATVGISHHAQEALGDIVFVELPEVGSDAQAGKTAVTVESVKTSAEVYSPVNGEVVEINDKLPDTPELINKDPHVEGWMFKLKVSDAAQADSLMSSDVYAEYEQKDS